jgi:hypothetical protein
MKPSRLFLGLALASLAACGRQADAPRAVSELESRSANPSDSDAIQSEGAADSGTQRAIEQLSAAYADLAARLQDNSAEAVGWAQEDVDKLGDWEYRIVDLEADSAETLESALNGLGEERWEAYWIESSAAGTRVFLKRPATSYISRLPLSVILRLLAGGAP